MKEKNWVVYNGPNHDLDWFETREEAESYIQELITNELEEAIEYGFSDECDEYWLLNVAGRADLSLWKRRCDMKIDDEGCDEEGDYWAEDVEQFCHLKYLPSPSFLEIESLIKRTENYGIEKNPDGSVSCSVTISMEGAYRNLMATKGVSRFGMEEVIRLHKIAKKAWMNGDFETVADYFGCVK